MSIGDMMQQDNSFHKINAVLAEEDKSQESKDSFISESGIVMKLHKVPQALVQKLMIRYPDPVPPMIWLEDREENIPNYADPAYNSALSQNIQLKSLAAQNLWFARGVTVVTMPAWVLPWEGSEWLEGIEYLTEDVPARGPGRMAAWIMYYALPGDDEQMRLILKIQMLSGQVTEAMAQSAMDAFRGGEERRSDTEPAGATANTTGDSLPPPTPITGPSV